jgi:hypothetical protein
VADNVPSTCMFLYLLPTNCATKSSIYGIISESESHEVLLKKCREQSSNLPFNLRLAPLVHRHAHPPPTVGYATVPSPHASSNATHPTSTSTNRWLPLYSGL